MEFKDLKVGDVFLGKANDNKTWRCKKLSNDSAQAIIGGMVFKMKPNWPVKKVGTVKKKK